MPRVQQWIERSWVLPSLFFQICVSSFTPYIQSVTESCASARKHSSLYLHDHHSSPNYYYPLVELGQHPHKVLFIVPILNSFSICFPHCNHGNMFLIHFLYHHSLGEHDPGVSHHSEESVKSLVWPRRPWTIESLLTSPLPSACMLSVPPGLTLTCAFTMPAGPSHMLFPAWKANCPLPLLPVGSLSHILRGES